MSKANMKNEKCEICGKPATIEVNTEHIFKIGEKVIYGTGSVRYFCAGHPIGETIHDEENTIVRYLRENGE